jgi:hypothetical protein
MKFANERPYADPRKIFEIANSIEPVQDGRIHIHPHRSLRRCNDREIEDFRDTRQRGDIVQAQIRRLPHRLINHQIGIYDGVDAPRRHG